MKNKKKYLFFTLFALGFMLTGINNQVSEENITNIASAAETGFVIDNNGILTKYTGTDTSVIIPDGVTSIGDRAFFNCTSANTIIIPDSVTNIGERVFWGCKNLEEITIPDSVTSIGGGTFKNCKSLKEITIPDNVKIIEQAMFTGCNNLKKIVLPNGITDIKASAFYDCHSLIKINFPDSLVTIEDNAFANCHNLTGITLPDSLKKIGHWAFINCRNLKEITVPENVLYIGDMAFAGCKKLTSVTIPDKTTEIGDFVVKNCPALKKITVKPGNKTYQSKDGVLFKKVQSGLKLVAYPSGKTEKTYKFPVKTKNVEYDAFSECKNLTKVILPGNMKKIYYKKNSFFGSLYLKNIKITMKKSQKLNIDFIMYNDDSVIPKITSQNKNIARINMPAKWKNIDDNIGSYTSKGTIKAIKKGKLKIIFSGVVNQNKKLKTTLEITVK